MKKVLLAILLVMLLSIISCEYIPQYKFSTEISQDYIAGKYYYTTTENPSDSTIVLTMSKDTSYTYLGGNENVVDYMPASGIYIVNYTSFGITTAGGEIIFKNLDTLESSRATFVWTASAVEGPLSLSLEFPDHGNARVNLTYGGKN